MTTGLSLLKKLCVQQSRTSFREMNPDHLLEEEMPLFEIVNNHYRLYGVLPTLEALQDQGYSSIAMVRDNEPADYYIQRMAERHIVMQSRDIIQPLQQAVINGNAAVITELITSMGGVVRQTMTQSAVMTLGQALEQVMADYHIAHTSPGIQGLTFGYDWLDNITGGLQQGDLATLAAETNMGKSYFLNHFALSAWMSGASVLVISMEMTAVQMATRMLAQYTGVNPDFLRRGTMSHWTTQRVEAEVLAMANGPQFIIVDGSFDLKMDDVDNLVQEFNPDAIYVDAAYLIIPTERRHTEKGWERQREMSKDMKRLGMRRRKPICQTVQLSGDGYGQKKEKLNTGMIGGSIGIGQDSQTVMFLTPGQEPNAEAERDIIVGKNREGAKSWMRTNFLFAPMDFSYKTCKEAEADTAPQAPAGWSI